MEEEIVNENKKEGGKIKNKERKIRAAEKESKRKNERKRKK